MTAPVKAVAPSWEADDLWEEPLPEIPMDRAVLVSPALLLLCMAVAVALLLLGGDP